MDTEQHEPRERLIGQQYKVGSVITGLVVCDLCVEEKLAEESKGISQWLGENASQYAVEKPGSFVFTEGESKDSLLTNSPRISITLIDSSEPDVVDMSQGNYYVYGTITDQNFWQRIPHLAYNLSERSRQENSRTVTCHAAAVARDNKDGILILGDKGSGKTSLAIALAKERDNTLIGNDLVLLRGNNHSGIEIVSGSSAVDIRGTTFSRVSLEQSAQLSDNGDQGIYEQKTRVSAGELGIKLQNEAVRLALVLRVNIHDRNPAFTIATSINKIAEPLRVFENLSRYIGGMVTPVSLLDGRISGHFPQLDTRELYKMRAEMTNKLVNDTPFWYVYGNDANIVAGEILKIA